MIDSSIEGAASTGLLQERLLKGDQLCEAGARLRLTIPVRPVFRGGRSWLVTPDGAEGLARSRTVPAITRAL